MGNGSGGARDDIAAGADADRRASSPRIDVAGEALVDLIRAADGRFDAVAGGAPANVALGLARLGVPCRFLGCLGADAFAALNRDRLARAGVDLSSTRTVDHPSSVAIVSSRRGVPSYSFYLDGTADRAWDERNLPPDAPEAIHIGSLAAALSPARDVIAAHTEKLAAVGATTISLDPNIRPLPNFDRDAEVGRVLGLARLAHLIKLSDEDVALLYPDASISATVSAWRADGVNAEIIVTSGADGAALYRPQGTVLRVSAAPVVVVDTIGAGDAFAAATLAGLCDTGALGADPAARLASVPDETWTAILAAASVAASLTCGRPGADPPTRREWTDARDMA